jgi:carboxyl-terminal processing protease
MKKFLRNIFILLFGWSSILCQPEKEEERKQEFDGIIYNWSRTYAEVLQLVNQKHYKVANAQECMIKSIDGFLTCLDPHSNFLDPKTYKSIMESTSGEFFGIGIMVDNTRSSKDKFLLVVDVVPKNPADKAGIKQYDKIIEISGESLEGMSTDQATSKLKGPRGTKVTVKIMREGQSELLSYTITRDIIKEPSSICFYLPEQQVYYLSLSMFAENSAKQIEELLKKAKSQPYKALILDLRNNSGGLLTSVIDIAGLFLEKGSLVVTTKDKNNKELEKYVTSRNPVATSGVALFILINNFTASAAEILAGCLKIHAEKHDKKASNNKWVFLVGTRSFGKGSVQEVIPISNNCAVKLTTSLYFLPGDSSIQGIGITPDFIIERCLPPTDQQQWFAKHYGSEQALTNYIKVHEESESKKKEADAKKELSWFERAKENLEIDNQLRQTLNLINLLDVLQTKCPGIITNRAQAVALMNERYFHGNKLNLVEIKI